LDPVVLVIFALVYLGMILGRIPGLALDRTGVALLGAIALIAARRISPAAAWDAVDVPTLALLFGLMVVSGQLRLSGFYGRITHRLAEMDVSPPTFLALLIAVAGALSSVLTNDIVCLAMAPLLVEGCARRRLDPVPFLLALACASNVGSAATLIGNPQNMLIGQKLGLSFRGYLAEALVPSALGLVVVYLVVLRSARGKWSAPAGDPHVAAPSYDPWQTGKALAATVALVLAFLFTSWPREVLALGAAGMLLLSRKTASRELLSVVDGQLLLLFIGLFVVNHALEATGTLPPLVERLRASGIDVAHPAWLFALCVPLSNLVSNVPAVMLLLPTARHSLAGPVLALASTLAGNLLLVGSIANLIVVDQAASHGIRIGWRRHAKVGVPVTIATLAIAAAWLALRAGRA
jgi:Na+/H+ antiporter NhaD/arsenite permease-like protein